MQHLFLFVFVLSSVCGCVKANLERPEAKEKPAGSSGGQRNVDNGDGSRQPTPSQSENAESLQAIIKECGGDGLMQPNQDPNTPLLQKNIQSLPFRVLRNDVTVSASLQVYPDKMNQSVAINSNSETIVVSIAESVTNGSSEFRLVPFTDYVSLGKYETWKGILCTLVPVTGVSHRSESGKEIKVEFDPPVPMQLSPRASQKRYLEELGTLNVGDKKVFTGLKAKVLESAFAGIAKDAEFDGTVTIERIESSAEFTDSQGRQYSVNADIAFKVDINFGRATGRMGLNKSSSYYISHDKKDVVANVINGLIRVAFIHD